MRMTPSARIASTIDLFSIVLDKHAPMDVTARDWFRARKFIGSKDRAEIADRLYRIMRHRARYQWWLEQNNLDFNARNLVITDCAFHDDKAEERLFSGGGKYAAEGLNSDEQTYLNMLAGQKIEHKDMPEAARLEIPDWALDKLKQRFGDGLEQEMLAMQEPAALDIRVNTLLTTKEQAKESLTTDKVEYEDSQYSPFGLRIKGKPYLAKTKAFHKGWVEIQDEGSQLISLLCDAKPGMRVMDYCAGGGGKTLALAAMMENKGSIVAADIDKRRLEKGKKRYRKAGVHNVEMKPLEDEQVKKWFKRQKETFDVVLVDAPCSSSGTWRRNPDIRWHFYGPSLDEILTLQTQILEKVAKCVKPGGKLVYATCSLFTQENEEQVERFLSSHPDYSLIPLSKAWPLDTMPPCGEDMMRLSPGQHNTDGFFTAVLQRS